MFRTLSNHRLLYFSKNYDLIYDEVFYSEPFITLPYLDSWYIQNLSIFRTYNIQNTIGTEEYWEIIQTYVMDRFLPEHWYIQNSRLIQNPVKYPWWRICSEPCITLAYLEAWHSQNPRHTQNTVKHLSWNTYSKPCITLTYSEP